MALHSVLSVQALRCGGSTTEAQRVEVQRCYHQAKTFLQLFMYSLR